uniref:U-scoloptoxin(05)-Er2a n=1 Tax=Ethmostigmus rubripes TaxID=62613 RepID=TX52A_ETHRU|nr:RecName: Full=U-scoloptoxin(05)-Er2a; Short=U-SLPTX(05)-Er2a; Flags: Precursor [Ethmostigmus rubripes]
MTFVVAAVVLLTVVPLATPLKCVQCDGPLTEFDCKTTVPEAKDCPQLNTHCFRNDTFNSKNELIMVRRGCTNEKEPSPPCQEVGNGGRRCTYTCNSDGCNNAPGFAIAIEPSRMVIFIVTFSVMISFILHTSAN